MKNLLCSLLITSFCLSAIAQNNLAIGDWRAHLPYRCFKYLTQSESTLYCATSESLMMLDKEEMSIERMSRVDGLSNSSMGVIKYNASNDILIVSYQNSVFDLVKPDGIITFEDIKTGGVFTDRAIYDIYLHEAHFVFFACGFGIVKFDLINEEFIYTTDFGISVNSVIIFEGIIYAATEEGIYTVPNDDNLNLQDFNNWTLLDIDAGFPPVYSSKYITVYNNQLHFDLNDDLYRMTSDGLELLYETETDLSAMYLTAEGSGLIFGLSDKSGCGNCLSKTLYFNADGNYNELGGDCANRPLYAIEDSQNRIWLADNWRGLRLANDEISPCQKLDFNSPLTSKASELYIENDALHVASGGVNAVGNFIGRVDGGFVLRENGDWDIYNILTHSVFLENNTKDFYKVAVHPTNGKIYYGSFGHGLIEIDGDNIVIYDDTNSILQSAVGDPNSKRISGLAFDKEGNLWMCNHLSQKPLVVLKTDGSWQSYAVPSSTNIRNLTIDNNGYKWCTIDGTSQGVIVFDEGGTIDDFSDDRYQIISSSNTELPDNSVLSIAVDTRGDVWLGTSNGVGLAQCGDLERPCNVSKVIIEENVIDDEPEYLFKGEAVLSIAVNGANQKWFGTSNGVFLQSENGKEDIAFFNQSNSPLLDNTVIDIAINGNSGEVFFATNQGIISYQGAATEGQSTNSSNVYAYPNPVRPDYSGPIAIKGLAQNANVKITDISGQLIYETEALGGQAIWNGRDYNGRKASTGVYLVFSTSNSLETPDAIVAKILFIN